MFAGGGSVASTGIDLSHYLPKFDIPRFDIGGSPSLDDFAESFRSIPNTPSVPKLDPGNGGPMRRVEFFMNGERKGRGLADDELLDSLHRSSVKESQTRAGKEPYWRRV